MRKVAREPADPRDHSTTAPLPTCQAQEALALVDTRITGLQDRASRDHMRAFVTMCPFDEMKKPVPMPDPYKGVLIRKLPNPFMSRRQSEELV
jgi:hypothetical protein